MLKQIQIQTQQWEGCSCWLKHSKKINLAQFVKYCTAGAANTTLPSYLGEMSYSLKKTRGILVSILGNIISCTTTILLLSHFTRLNKWLAFLNNDCFFKMKAGWEKNHWNQLMVQVLLATSKSTFNKISKFKTSVKV